MKLVTVVFVAVFVPLCARAMADRTTPPIYGVPTLYGEYELSGEDVARASNMYGNVPAPHVAPIRAGVAKGGVVVKQPIKNKKVAPKKKTAKKKKSQQMPVPKEDVAKKVPDVVTNDVAIVSDAVTPPPVAEKTEITPSPYADTIAVHAADKIDVDSFCTHVGRPGAGKLPDNIIMMPGRPDLMSCVSNNKH